MHRDIIILHKCTKNHDNMLYCSWDMVHDGCNFYFSFWTIFCPFTPLTTKTIKTLKKWKKTHRDIIILHKCIKNRDNMLYCSWDMACDRCNFYCSFWTIFCPFTPLTTKTIKTLKKWRKKTHGDIIILHKSTKIMIICYTVPQIWHGMDVIFLFHFGLFFALSPPLWPWIIWLPNCISVTLCLYYFIVIIIILFLLG